MVANVASLLAGHGNSGGRVRPGEALVVTPAEGYPPPSPLAAMLRGKARPPPAPR
jgi:hypothetical protein